MRVLVDTCVVIDVLQHREPFWKDAFAVFLSVANRYADGFLTAKSLTDVYYLTHCATHDDRETRRVLSALLVAFDLLDTAGLDCRRAISAQLSDFEDAVMAETALRSGMDCIVTRNERNYKNSPVPVYTPSAFLELTASKES